MKITISEVLKEGINKLKKNSIPNSGKEASRLLELVIKKNPLLLNQNNLLAKKDYNKYLNLIERRSNQEPFAYISGRVNFCNLEIYTDKNTLIPRPETETLVQIVAKFLAKNKNKQLRIAEIGTGTGAISIALGSSFPEITITATDKYKKPLKIARQNIVRHNLSNQINLKNCDLLQPFENNSLDLIIANLPYIPTGLKPQLDLTITNFEPHTALFAGKKGLDLILKLIKQAQKKCRPKARIFLEIWPGQEVTLKEIIVNMGNEVKFQKDVGGITRFAEVIKNSPA